MRVVPPICPLTWVVTIDFLVRATLPSAEVGLPEPGVRVYLQAPCVSKDLRRILRPFQIGRHHVRHVPFHRSHCDFSSLRNPDCRQGRIQLPLHAPRCVVFRLTVADQNKPTFHERALEFLGIWRWASQWQVIDRFDIEDVNLGVRIPIRTTINLLDAFDLDLRSV